MKIITIILLKIQVKIATRKMKKYAKDFDSIMFKAYGDLRRSYKDSIMFLKSDLGK